MDELENQVLTDYEKSVAINKIKGLYTNFKEQEILEYTRNIIPIIYNYINYTNYLCIIQIK